MEQANQIKINPPVGNTRRLDAGQADAWVSQKIREKNGKKQVDHNRLENQYQTLADKHASRSYRHLYHHASDQFKRADRDLGETAAFIAASLTTATAIEAVMTVANDKLGLSKEILQEGFSVYIGVILLIILFGVVRGKRTLQKRASAEKEIDQAKVGIFRSSPDEQWPNSDG